MKKLLLLALVAGVGYVLWRAYTEQEAREIWTEVTDDIE